MLRSSVLYRRLWYMKRRNSIKLHVLSRIAVILFILAPLVLYAKISVLPKVVAYSEYKLEAEVDGVISDAAADGLFQELNCEDAVLITRNSAGYITSIETDTELLERLAADISAIIQERLAAQGIRQISLPLGVMMGTSSFIGGGPDIYINIHPHPEVEAYFKPEFTSCGDNKTKYSLTLDVSARVMLDIPFAGRECKYSTEIPIGETIILESIQHD